MADATDFPDPSHPTLSPDKRKEFTDWLKEPTQKTGRDVSKDLYDYDLAGWYGKNGPQDLTGAHLTDEYKKPNHPTFSNQSVYNGVDGYQGGNWDTQPDGTYAFTPGGTNVFSMDELQNYFSKVEPNNQLNLPPT